MIVWCCGFGMGCSLVEFVFFLKQLLIFIPNSISILNTLALILEYSPFDYLYLSSFSFKQLNIKVVFIFLINFDFIH